jgi:hypothetical protein
LGGGKDLEGLDCSGIDLLADAGTNLLVVIAGGLLDCFEGLFGKATDFLNLGVDGSPVDSPGALLNCMV